MWNKSENIQMNLNTHTHTHNPHIIKIDRSLI